MIIETLLGGVFGGLLRLAPEALKLLDRKADRDHEFRMLDKELEFAKTKSEAQLKQSEFSYQEKDLDTLTAALDNQSTLVENSGVIAATFSALVRPIVTYILMLLYTVVKIATGLLAYTNNVDFSIILSSLWTQDDMAVLNMILSFWFVGRIYDRSKGP